MKAALRSARVRAPRRSVLPACLQGEPSTRFLVEMAHDLRSPLTAILTLAESLASGVSGPLTPSQQKQLGLIHAAALRLVGTTSDAIELARGNEGGPEPVRRCSLRTIFTEARAIVLPMAEEKGLFVTLAGEGEERRLAPERSLRRVLLNLMTNALKVTEAGGVRVQFREVGTGEVEFAVFDTGPGMNLETLRDLWRPFRPTARGTHSAFSSAGLGLSICRKLVAEMGGELTVATTLGAGSRFAFTLPLARAPQ